MWKIPTPEMVQSANRGDLSKTVKRIFALGGGLDQRCSVFSSNPKCVLCFSDNAEINFWMPRSISSKYRLSRKTDASVLETDCCLLKSSPGVL